MTDSDNQAVLDLIGGFLRAVRHMQDDPIAWECFVRWGRPIRFDACGQVLEVRIVTELAVEEIGLEAAMFPFAD
jgi:hypothetical protein